MEFAGTGSKLGPGDIQDAADLLECDVAAVRAIIEVEAASYGFDHKNRPRILFEPHIFHRELSGAQRTRAVNAGLAYPSWGTEPYPKSMDGRYSQVNEAMKINKTAALRSASWGLGQIMGFNCKAAGFDTVTEFVGAMKKGEREQLLAMCRFIRANGLDKHARTRNWRAFARGYNGPSYAKHGYHTRLANAYERFSMDYATAHTAGESNTLLQRGMTHPAVQELRERLTSYGYDVDGIGPTFGPKTEAAVREFQAAHDLLVDGVVGKATWAVLRSSPDEDDPDPEDAIPAPTGTDHEKPPVLEIEDDHEENTLVKVIVGAIVAMIAAILAWLGIEGW